MKLRFTEPALADLRAVLDYIAENSPQGAMRVQRRLQSILDLIATHPGIGPRTDHPAIRRMPATPYPYLIFYEVGEEDIIVHAIRHGARDPETHRGG